MPAKAVHTHLGSFYKGTTHNWELATVSLAQGDNSELETWSAVDKEEWQRSANPAQPTTTAAEDPETQNGEQGGTGNRNSTNCCTFHACGHRDQTQGRASQNKRMILTTMIKPIPPRMKSIGVSGSRSRPRVFSKIQASTEDLTTPGRGVVKNPKHQRRRHRLWIQDQPTYQQREYTEHKSTSLREDLSKQHTKAYTDNRENKATNGKITKNRSLQESTNRLTKPTEQKIRINKTRFTIINNDILVVVKSLRNKPIIGKRNRRRRLHITRELKPGRPQRNIRETIELKEKVRPRIQIRSRS